MCSKSIIRDCAKNFVIKCLFSTAISGYPAGYPVICRISGQRRISGRIPDIRHEQLAGYPVSCQKSIRPNPIIFPFLQSSSATKVTLIAAILLPDSGGCQTMHIFFKRATIWDTICLYCIKSPNMAKSRIQSCVFLRIFTYTDIGLF